MSNVIPFSEGKLPAHLRKANAADANAALTQGVSSGFPVLSIKGKTFTIVSGDTRNIISKADDPDEPASNIQVVILDANPHLSKVYYDKEYEEGTDSKPLCYSNDGKYPAADAEEQQSKTCATCPHNAWGTGRNGRGKACSDSRRLAVAPAGQLNEPMLLRVPPATLKPLQEYGTMLAKRGVAFDAVVTKLKFDPSESSPKLIFTPVGFLDEEQYEEAQEAKEDDIIGQIIGTNVVPAPAPSDEDDDDEPAPKPKRTRKPKPEPADEDEDDEDEPAPKPKRTRKPKPKPEPADEDDDDEDEDEEPAPKSKRAPKRKPQNDPEPDPAPDGDDDDDDLDALLDEFDD